MYIQGHISARCNEAILLPLQGQVASSGVNGCNVLSYFLNKVSVHVQSSVADATVSYFAVITAYYAYLHTDLATDAAYLYSIVCGTNHKYDVVPSYG